MAVCAITLGFTNSRLIFAAIIVVWGGLFWFGLPAVFSLLAARSKHPADRAGDAQAIMAFGRTLGPLLGGFLYDKHGAATLSIVAGSFIVLSGIVFLTVELLVPPLNPSQQIAVE